jgi:hypothetical protein
MRPELPHVIELELWSAPGAALPEHSGKAISERARVALGLPAEVLLGLSSVPDRSDSENLQTAIQEGELSEFEFRRFCEAESLEPSVSSNHSACRYLAHAFGERLAWVHIPAGASAVLLAQRLTQWARAEGLCIVEPHQLFCVLQGVTVADLQPTDA